MPGRCAKVAGEMCKGRRGDVATWENKVNNFSIQLKVELGLQVREEFDKNRVSVDCTRKDMITIKCL